MPKPIIMTCAPTGGIHTPTMSPHLPVATADEARKRLALKGAAHVTV